MRETKLIVDLWRRARGRGDRVYLATVVHSKGSSYRKPGARMLLTSSGERAGTISGGCLEAEVARRIAWITKDSSALLSYGPSLNDDGKGLSYDLGCGGTIWILMEGGSAAAAALDALERSVDEREASVIVVALKDRAPGTRLVVGINDLDPVRGYGAEREPPISASDGQRVTGREPNVEKLLSLSRRALYERRPVADSFVSQADLPAVLALPVLPPPRLRVFGAGDDAKPLVRFAAELGWDITVADGRSHLVSGERFPQADVLRTLIFRNTSTNERLDGPDIELDGPTPVKRGDLAVILTHSYAQDGALLKALLVEPLRYLGILGPLHRTRSLLAAIAPSLGLSVDECLERLHAPVGLAIGSAEPSVIALAIIAEIQAELSNQSIHVTPKLSSVNRLLPDVPSAIATYA